MCKGDRNVYKEEPIANDGGTEELNELKLYLHIQTPVPEHA